MDNLEYNTEPSQSGGKGTHAKVVVIVVIIIVALAALAGFRLFGSYFNPDEQAADDAVNVKAVEAVTGDIEVTSVHTGKVASENEVNVVPKIPGKVLSVNVELGDKVSKGDKLFSVDPTDVETQAEQARIQSDSASKGRSTAATAINDAKKARKDAEKSLKDIKKQIKKTEQAIKEAGKAGPAGLEALARAQAALQQLEQAKAQTESGISQAKAGVKQAQSAYDQADAQYRLAGVGVSAAENAVSDTSVVAPISGYVTGVTVQKGGMVSQAMPAVVITGTGNIQVTTTVAESTLGKIKADDEVNILIKAVSDEPYRGTIRQVAPAPPTGQTTYPVVIDFDRSGAELKPGMFAEVTMTAGRAEGVCLIPSDAVMIREGKEVVAILDGNDKVEIREVSTGIDDGENVEVSSGVSPGERIVKEGQHYINEDSKVTVAE
jgi:RND family efflux transporter MFP subunit